MSVACLSFILLFFPDTHAGSFSINPVRVELSASQSSAVIHVNNNGDAPVTVEARSFLWSQSEGNDQLTATRDVIVTPQIFRINPGATQVLRLGLLRKPDPVRELAYRLMLEEILPPPTPDFKGVRVALRISMPVFLTPAADAKEKLDVAISMDPDRLLRLQLSNSGMASVHLSDIQLFDEDKPATLIASHKASTYVLSGQRRELLLKAKALDPDRKLFIKAQTHAGLLEFHAVPVSY